MREPPNDETPEERVRRQRRGEPTATRLARIEEREDGTDEELKQLRRSLERLEGRLWLLVTGAAGAGSAIGATAAAIWSATGGG